MSSTFNNLYLKKHTEEMAKQCILPQYLVEVGIIVFLL